MIPLVEPAQDADRETNILLEWALNWETWKQKDKIWGSSKISWTFLEKLSHRLDF
jgi:hypothetical protein